MRRLKFWDCPKCDTRMGGMEKQCARCKHNPSEETMRELGRFLAKSFKTMKGEVER